jgi:hypothetical protein
MMRDFILWEREQEHICNGIVQRMTGKLAKHPIVVHKSFLVLVLSTQ